MKPIECCAAKALSILHTPTDIEMLSLTSASKGERYKICSNSQFSKVLKNNQRRNNEIDC
jgi:hypothetical protein